MFCFNVTVSENFYWMFTQNLKKRCLFQRLMQQMTTFARPLMHTLCSEQNFNCLQCFQNKGTVSDLYIICMLLLPNFFLVCYDSPR